MPVVTTQDKATEKLQVAQNNINQWMEDWNISLNGTKLTHVIKIVRKLCHKNIKS